MENVMAFNNELSGLYDTKPPISKAKMAAITKAAMRAIKFYKHVVQSVEKFILKCKPEYKVPGLYVIDSIVRQSRHQFGVEKDVFAPRFARNMKETFANLFRCAPEDKSRIIRVLNLWQKNNVFAPEVIQPLFDLADPNHPIYQMPPQPSANASTNDISSTSNGLNTSIGSVEMNTSAGNMSMTGSGTTSNTNANAVSQAIVDDKMVIPDLSNNNLKQLLKDPNVLRQLQTLQNFQKIKQEELRLQEEAFEKHIQSVLKASVAGEGGEIPNKGEVEFISEETKIEVINLDGNDSRTPTPDRDRYNKRRRSRSRSKSRSRDRGATRERRRRSRSRSRSRSRRRTSRERDRERERLSERNRDKEKEKEREHERERRRKGLPDMKKEHLSVCSTTLWVGHLSKLVYQEELSDTFGKYGEIVSIDQIVPRGCAFIVMHRRQDASKAMSALKNHKLQGRAITISWAAGKGVKSKEWKDFWDLELGVTYIPWSKLSDDTDVDALEEGGMFDEDTMPSWMKDKINSIKNVKDNTPANSNASGLLYPVDNMPKIDITQPPPQAAGMLPMPPFTMAPPLGGQPRLMPPMGVPMPGNLIPGLPVPPAMVPGMPPPHPMMMNPAMMPPPGYPPIPQLDKNIPPPNIRPDGQNLGNIPPSPFLGTPGLIPTLPLPTPQAFQQQPNANNATSDDQMDIEMEDEVQVNSGGGGAVLARNSPQPVPQVNFNQPPPAFQGGSGVSGVFPDGGMPHIPDSGNEDFSRDRNRGNNMRWGGADEREPNRDRPNDGGEIWNDGGNTIPTIGGGRNFDMNRRGGGGLPVNIPPFEINNHPQRPDFFDNRHGNGSDDYDRRGGPGRGNNGGPQDFFPNMQNRFNQPNNIMQMRIQPPPVFNNRMGGPGMGGPGMGGPSMGPLPGIFVRGQGPRPQETPTGGGFNFNDRPSFNRDMDNGNRMRGGRGMNMNDRRGGRGGGGRSGPNIWRDNDEEEDNGIFKRRMGGSSRFSGSRDRDNSHEDNRMNRDNRDSRSGNRRSMNDRGSRDQRDKRDSGDRRDNGDRREAAGDRDQPSRKTPEKEKQVPESSVPLDTEEDWDLELSEHQVETGPKIASPKRSKSIENDEEVWDDGVNSGQPQQQMEEEMSVPSSTPVDEEIKKTTEEPQNSLSTPLYDEPHQVSEARNASDKEPEDNADITSAADNISEEEAPVATEEVAEE